VILATLDRLVVTGRLTGYTVEEDTGYLESTIPTLTYRMYADGEASQLNLGAFAAAMAELGPRMRLSRVRGNLGDEGTIRRSNQLCLTAEFESEGALEKAVDVVHRRFVAAPAAAPGSWRFPDVRVVGGDPANTSSVFAHHWSSAGASAVALTLGAKPPAEGARTIGVRVLCNWVSFLQRSGELAAAAR
jgi:hypothetical protein